MGERGGQRPAERGGRGTSSAPKEVMARLKDDICEEDEAAACRAGPLCSNTYFFFLKFVKLARPTTKSCLGSNLVFANIAYLIFLGSEPFSFDSKNVLNHETY